MQFRDKTIGIIGCGGLGGYVVEEAARLNPKKLIIMDGDTFNLSNLNRQIYATSNSLGRYKALCAAEKIRICSSAPVIAYTDFLNEENIHIFKECDLIFDCLDNIKTRLMLEKFAEENNIPLVHGAVGKNYGNVCLCLPGSKMMERLYEKTKDDKPLSTNSFTVATIASLEVAVAYNYFHGTHEDLIDKIIYVDLVDLEIKKMKL